MNRVRDGALGRLAEHSALLLMLMGLSFGGAIRVSARPTLLPSYRRPDPQSAMSPAATRSPDLGCGGRSTNVPRLTIVLEYVDASHPTQTGFTGTNGLGEFTLGEAEGYKKVFDNLATGSYTITEQVPPGFRASVQCDDPLGASGSDSVTVDINICSLTTCTFTDVRLGEGAVYVPTVIR